jgi:cysteine-rich repeat protein
MVRAALLVMLAGCSRILGVNDVTLGDGGSDSGPVTAPPNTVIGRSHNTCLQQSGPVDNPRDLSQAIVQALVPNTTDGYSVVNGTGKADGSFTIGNVPDGVTYMLRLGTFYFVTEQHVVDVRSQSVTRCDPKPATASAPTPVVLDVSGMAPYSAGDRLELDSLALGYQGLLPPGAFHRGDTAVHLTFDWSRGVTTSPLADTAAGDDLSVFHWQSENFLDPTVQRNRSVSRLVDWFQPTGIRLESGGSASISGSFQHVAVNKSVTFSIDRSQWDAGYDNGSYFTGLSVAIAASPIMTETFVEAMLVGFDLNDFSHSTSSRQNITNYMYGDPYPDAWNRYTVLSYVRFRRFKHPAATSAGFFAATNRQVAAYAPAINTTPIVQPPGGVKINGIDFSLGGKVAFDGTIAVTLTWNTALSAKSYSLQVLRESATDRQSIATISTSATSLKIPAELFIPGQFYVFVLSAVRTPSEFTSGQVVPIGLPSAVATTMSGLFRFSSDCGDGVVKGGEEDCDTSGETAMCDVDCTMPVCGDGLRNAAAGEACDTVSDTSGCDSDCTLPMCGDGHANVALEDCDDGNAVDSGNGCSRECKFNNVCGNGRLEQVVEQCDPGTGGDTANCDADCTIPQCGDGHVNTFAGEECDNGSDNGTGTCSVTCKRQ